MRLSTGKIHSDNSLGRTSAPIGQNRGMSNIAQQAIDTLATVAVRKNIEAIRTDGYPVYVLRSRRGTNRCTCKPLELKKPGQISDTEFVMEDGYNPDSNRPKTKATINVRGGGMQDSFLDRSDMFGQTDDLVVDDTVTNLYASEIGNYDLENNDDLVNILFPSIDDKRCGICGGTGFTDSYTWVSGHRIILLPANATLVDGFVNDATQPNSMEVTGAGGYAQWTVMIPAYFICLETYRVRDNIEEEHGLTLTIDIGDGNGFVEFTANVLDPLRMTGGSVTIRAAAKGTVDTVRLFTHIDIYLKTVELPYCQFPQLERDTNPGASESNLSPDYEIEQSVGELPRGSLIESPNHARVFTVLTDRTKRTAKGIIFNVGGNSLVLQPTAPLTSLALIPRWTMKNARNWRGIEAGPERTGLTANGEPNPYDSGNNLGATGASGFDEVPTVNNNGLANDSVRRRLKVNLTGLNSLDQ